MTPFLWDGPQDSDEEVEEMLPYKCQFEVEMGVKYSKKGLIEFIEQFLAHENPKNKKDKKNGVLWEENIKTPQIAMFMKKGGSHINSNQPFIRNEFSFMKKFKMNKLINVVSKEI